MTTKTTSAPARSGIQLNQQIFKKAIAKAEDVRPRVVHIGAHYGVLQADQKSWAHVIFTIFNGRLFASCTCYAHTRGDCGKPVPCYHIAAAALSKKAAAEIVIDEVQLSPCENAPACAPGLCGPACETANLLAEEAARYFHEEALLRKPEGKNRCIIDGWDL